MDHYWVNCYEYEGYDCSSNCNSVEALDIRGSRSNVGKLENASHYNCEVLVKYNRIEVPKRPIRECKIQMS